MSRKIWFVLSAALCSIAVGGVFAGAKLAGDGEPAPTPEIRKVIKLYHVKDTGSAGTLSYPARVGAKRHAKLFFRVSGPVLENELKLGMAVRKGDVLMRIDPRDYERETERLSHNIAMLKSKHRYLEQEYLRMEKLLQSNAISKASYEAALSTRDASLAEIRTQETALKIAADRLADTRLTAPFDGRITELAIEKFEMARANEVVLSLQSLDELEVVVNLPEGNLPEIANLDRSGFRGQTFPVLFPGRAYRHQAVLDEFRPVTSAENGTYELRFSMKQPDGFMVFPGMTAEVCGLPERNSVNVRAPLIPFAAVFRQDGKAFVWRYDPPSGKLTRLPVIPGRLEGDWLETESVKPGTLIVAAGGAWLSESTIVSVLNPEVLHETH